MRIIIFLVGCLVVAPCAVAQRGERGNVKGPASELSTLVGRPTDRAAVISILSDQEMQAFVEYGTGSGKYTSKTLAATVKAGAPTEFELTGLTADTEWFYRVQMKPGGASAFKPGEEHRFRTARKRGSTFVFGVQGDSHPERVGRMYDPDLYVRTLRNVAADRPDFYFMMGDDFSIERLFEQKSLSQGAVDAVYARQRGYVGIVGATTPVMLVNGNHEQAAKYLLDGTAANGAVYAGRARTRFYPLPVPDPAKPFSGFYTGNAEPVEHVGLLRDYYAWEWGDALFVVIDPYWHSDVVVDNEAGTKAPKKDKNGKDTGETVRRGKGNRDLWQVTLGDAQYRWLEKTLRESRATFKFVFCHHVLGTGRGGVEEAGRYEWGGQDGGGKRDEGAANGGAKRGLSRFFQNRPTWDKPIHDLMKETGVTIFFQGHDHLYAHQELDGIVYQTCPNPADPTFTAFNREAYRSGDILPNSGHLRVTVTGGEGANVKVEYVRSFRTQDERDDAKNGSIGHSYIVKPRSVTRDDGAGRQERGS